MFDNDLERIYFNINNNAYYITDTTSDNPIQYNVKYIDDEFGVYGKDDWGEYVELELEYWNYYDFYKITREWNISDIIFGILDDDDINEFEKVYMKGDYTKLYGFTNNYSLFSSRFH